MATTIAVLGLGVMGAPMAANLARAGFTVRAWNRSVDGPGVEVAADAGAVIVRSAADAVAGADVVLTCVTHGDAVRAVLIEGPAGAALEPGTIVIDCSTIGPSAARQIADELAVRGVAFLDAPVSGSDVRAREGTLTIMVGGRRDAFDSATTVFETVGARIFYCGPSGSGQTVKLANQVLVAEHTIATSEALAFAAAAGIDPALVVEVCSTGAAGSWVLEHLGPREIAGDDAPGFAIKHMRKDIGLALGAIADANLALPGLAAADAAFAAVGDEELGTQAVRRRYAH